LIDGPTKLSSHFIVGDSLDFRTRRAGVDGMHHGWLAGSAAAPAILIAGLSFSDTLMLYRQDFENPAISRFNSQDVTPARVNRLYGDQPPGFRFSNSFTVETLWITGGRAFGDGYKDPEGTGGNYALGIWDRQNDQLGLAFDVGPLGFLNVGLDLSSIDLNCCTGPFVPEGDVPVLQLTLFDNPSGTPGIGTGLDLLDRTTVTAAASPDDVFDWTRSVVALDTSGNTNGNVVLQLDLVGGVYAAIDNIVITASDEAGDMGNGNVSIRAP
jgi:hypothetical protein